MIELAGHRRRQRDLGNQQQRVAAERKRRLDGIEIDLGLSGAGDAVQQERLERSTFNRGLDRLERHLLMAVQFAAALKGYGGDGRCSTSSVRIFRLASERAASLAPLTDFVHFSQIVRPGVKLEITQYFAFGFLQLAFGPLSRVTELSGEPTNCAADHDPPARLRSQ